MHLNWELQILTILNTILGIASECVNKGPLRFHVILGEIFSKSNPLRMMKNMIKLLSWRFGKYLGRFHMLTIKACSEAVLFREWSNEEFYCL